MISINGVNFTERQEKPGVGSAVALRAFFYNDGQRIDPFEVSSVSVFTYSNYQANSLFNSDNTVTATPLMQFAGSDAGAPDPESYYDGAWLAPQIAQTPDFAYASGVLKIGTGDFVAPLRLDKALSGVFEGAQLEASAGVSGAVSYIDVWTVKLLAGSKYQSFIHLFSLYEDAFFSVTEPLIVKTSTSLSNKHLRVGEKVDLKVPVEVTVENRNISQSIINTLKSTLVADGAFKITKVNDNQTLDGPFTVLGWADTSSTVNVTSDGTLVYTWDTSLIPTSSTFGEARGTYAVQVLYWANGQKVISPRFYVSLN